MVEDRGDWGEDLMIMLLLLVAGLTDANLERDCYWKEGEDFVKAGDVSIQQSLIQLSAPTRRYALSYAVFC